MSGHRSRKDRVDNGECGRRETLVKLVLTVEWEEALHLRFQDVDDDVLAFGWVFARDDGSVFWWRR